MDFWFLKDTGFDIIRKSILFFVGFCTGAAVSYIRFDIAMSYFAVFCALNFFVFERRLKHESKERLWNNRRFMYMAGSHVFSTFLGFVCLGFQRHDMELVIGMSIGAVITLIATFINAKSMVKKDESIKK